MADPSFGGSAVQSPSPASQESLKIRKFKQPFFLIGAISPARRVVNRLSVDENPNVASAGLGGVVVGSARGVKRRGQMFGL